MRERPSMQGRRTKVAGKKTDLLQPIENASVSAQDLQERGRGKVG